MPEDWSENVYVVHLSDDPALGDELDSLERDCGDTPRHGVLDFSAVSFVNSSNLSQLIRLRRQLNVGHCKLILAGVRPDVWSAFQVAGLDKLFSTAENVPLALAALQLAAAGWREVRIAGRECRSRKALCSGSGILSSRSAILTSSALTSPTRPRAASASAAPRPTVGRRSSSWPSRRPRARFSRRA